MDLLRKFLLVVALSVPALLFAAQTVDINTADKETLMNVKGIGEKRAEAIIAYREEHGPFQTVDELSDVQGVGQAIVDSNRDQLTASHKQ